MGVCLQMYRAKIGCFQNGRNRTKDNAQIAGHCTLFLTVLSRICTALWLLVYILVLCSSVSHKQPTYVKKKPTLPRLLVKLAICWNVFALLLLTSGDIHPNPGPHNDLTSISCILLNAQSLKTLDKKVNKIQDLKNIAYSEWPHIISICETWLYPESDSINGTKSEDILSKKYYNIIRKDRSNRGGGGVLTAVLTQIYSKERPDLECKIFSNNEISVCEIRPNPFKKIYIISAYKSQADDCNDFLDNLESTIENCIQTGCNDLLIMGDFNFSDLKWGTAPEAHISDRSKRFLNMCGTYVPI